MKKEDATPNQKEEVNEGQGAIGTTGSIQSITRPYLWTFGVVIYMGSGVFWGVAYAFVPIAIVQPLLAITVVFNFIFAAAFLDEKICFCDKLVTIPLLVVFNPDRHC